MRQRPLAKPGHEKVEPEATVPQERQQQRPPRPLPGKLADPMRYGQEGPTPIGPSTIESPSSTEVPRAVVPAIVRQNEAQAVLSVRLLDFDTQSLGERVIVVEESLLHFAARVQRIDGEADQAVFVRDRDNLPRDDSTARVACVEHLMIRLQQDRRGGKCEPSTDAETGAHVGSELQDLEGIPLDFDPNRAVEPDAVLPDVAPDARMLAIPCPGGGMVREIAGVAAPIGVEEAAQRAAIVVDPREQAQGMQLGPRDLLDGEPAPEFVAGGLLDPLQPSQKKPVAQDTAISVEPGGSEFDRSASPLRQPRGNGTRDSGSAQVPDLEAEFAQRSGGGIDLKEAVRAAGHDDSPARRPARDAERFRGSQELSGRREERGPDEIWELADERAKAARDEMGIVVAAAGLFERFPRAIRRGED